MHKTVSTKERIKPLPAVLLVIGGILALTHILATLAFTGPDTAIKQSLQPHLNRYFLGPLDQGWNLFAPGPYSQDEYLLVRACVSPAETCAAGASGGAEFTEWRNVTAEEMEQRPYNIFTNREARQSKVVHSRFWSAASELDQDYRAMAEDNHVQGDPVFGVDLYSEEAEQEFNPSQLNKLRSYQRLEDVAVGFASLYAHREWGPSVSFVEVRMRRDAVAPFAQRHEPPVEESQSFTNIGWRDVKEFDQEVLAAWN